MTYREFTFWSPILGETAVRLSMHKDTREFFMIVPKAGEGKWRDRRAQALGYLAEAIESGCEPGEVRVANAVL